MAFAFLASQSKVSSSIQNFERVAKESPKTVHVFRTSTHTRCMRDEQFIPLDFMSLSYIECHTTSGNMWDNIFILLHSHASGRGGMWTVIGIPFDVAEYMQCVHWAKIGAIFNKFHIDIFTVHLTNTKSGMFRKSYYFLINEISFKINKEIILLQ